MACLRRFFPGVSSWLLLVAATAFPGLSAISAEPESPLIVVQQLIESGDTAAALSRLDRLLEADRKNYKAFLVRGNLHLARREKGEAREDFTQALFADSDSLRISARVGLAWTHYLLFGRFRQATEHLHRALAIDPDSREALYAKFRLHTTSGQSDNLWLSKEPLFKLLYQDPAYRDVYRLWRDSLPGKTENDVREVCAILAEFLKAHPDSANWWCDLAWDRFQVEGAGPALQTIEELRSANPAYRHPKIPLLEARCRLEKNGSTGFQDLYWQAVTLAGRVGDFEQLFIEAEPIFTPEDYQKWKAMQAEGIEEKFFHYFWAKVNPDKLSPVNKRLVEHYVRLRYAQREYKLRYQGGVYQSEEDQNYLIAFKTDTYDYDPRIMFKRCRRLGLDARGLLFLRHGEPDQRISGFPDWDPTMLRDADIKFFYLRSLSEQEKQSGRREYGKLFMVPNFTNRNEIWWYGKIYYVFEEMPLTGGFIYRPLHSTLQESLFSPSEMQVYTPPQGDMTIAMNTQGFRTDYLLEQEEYYLAQFMSPDRKGLEVEIYQDQPLPEGAAPFASAAAYDTLWYESYRSDSPVFPIPGADDNRWVAIHTLPFPPGKSRFAIRLAAGEKTWNGRGEINFPTFDTVYLQLSAIVLGVDPPDEVTPAHERRGVRFIPRPSFRFRQGEPIRVYLEYYNLQTGRESRRRYREYVDVLRHEGERGILGKIAGSLKGLLTFGEPKAGSSVTLIFDREAEKGRDPVAETFTIDTGELPAGQYRLLIEARDNANSFWDDEAVMFEIEGE